MHPPDLVRYASDVTPEWLTAVLTASGALHGARVTGVTASAIGTGQMADTARLAITYDQPGAGPPSAAVGKFASADEQSRATGLALRAYEIEVRFYREVASRVAARVPRLYFADVEPETGWFTLILEDIVGARQGDQIEACGPDTAAAVLTEMAGLHAPCWEAPELAALEWLNRNSPDADVLLAAMVGQLFPGFLERYADQLAPEHAALCQRFVDHLVQWSANRVGPRTASHGDFRLDNLLFQSDDPRPVVVDWQTLSWAGGSYDVAYFIGGCLSAEDRRACELDLLARYHDQLCARGVGDYSFAQLRRDTRRDTFGGVLMAIVASMVVQRTERGDLMFLTSTTRHAQHALDVEAEEFLLGPDDQLLVLCTGNAARSVMAGFMLEHLKAEATDRSDLTIVTAGTHTIDGQPMGMRTRTALAGIPELSHDSFSRHRSRQVYEADVVRSDLVVVMEADHVRYVRRTFPDAAARTAGIRRFCEDLPPGPPALAERVAALKLADGDLSDADDVTDPAGHDADVYTACVAELWELCQRLITLL